MGRGEKVGRRGQVPRSTLLVIAEGRVLKGAGVARVIDGANSAQTGPKLRDLIKIKVDEGGSSSDGRWIFLAIRIIRSND